MSDNMHDKFCPSYRSHPIGLCLCRLIESVRRDEETAQMEHLKSHRDQWVADGVEAGLEIAKRRVVQA